MGGIVGNPLFSNNTGSGEQQSQTGKNDLKLEIMALQLN